MYSTSRLGFPAMPQLSANIMLLCLSHRSYSSDTQGNILVQIPVAVLRQVLVPPSLMACWFGSQCVLGAGFLNFLFRKQSLVLRFRCAPDVLAERPKCLNQSCKHLQSTRGAGLMGSWTTLNPPPKILHSCGVWFWPSGLLLLLHQITYTCGYNLYSAGWSS